MASASHGSLPFREQIAFYRSKVPVPTHAWTDVYGAEHDHAAMVAGANKAELVGDLLGAIDKVVADGGTLREFRADFDAIVARHGWPYQGGRNWRTRVIYDTNLRQSYHAGREAQIADPELRRRRPYGLYRHSDAVTDPRPSHVAHDGLVLPLDDPWWDIWSPQNGWGCKCKKFTLSARDVERLGLTVAEAAPEIEWEERTVGVRGPSPRTVRVPKGIDPGFEHRPGATRTPATLDAVTRRIESIEAEAGARMLSALNVRWAAAGAFASWRQEPEGDWPLARLPEFDAQSIGAVSGVVRLSPATMRKQQREHPELSDAEYARAQHVIDRGRRVQDTPNSAIYILEETDGAVLVVRATTSGQAVFAQSYRRLSRDEAKRSREVARLRGER